MTRRWLWRLGLGVIVLALASEASATTWASREVTCPLCGTANTFRVIMSYGTYIYAWASKFQFIFWPYIDGNVLYSCKACRLTCFMWDFAKVSRAKAEPIRKQLEETKFDKEYDDYASIPMSQRLSLAEKVYGVLDKDDEFWCHFYRVVGYHCEREKQAEAAAGARRKALKLAEKMLADKGNAPVRKEVLLISGAMRYYLKDLAGARADFAEALKLRYEGRKGDRDAAAGKDEYLTELLGEYLDICADPAKAKARRDDNE